MLTIDKQELQKLIDGLTKDIRSYQAEFGSQIVFDPNSEASKLVSVRQKLAALMHRK